MPLILQEISLQYNKLKSLIMNHDFSIFSLDELEEKLNMKKDEILKKHKEYHKIWLASDGRWKTKVPDSTKTAGTRLLAKTSESDLTRAIVDWYTEVNTFATLESLYPKWISYKAKETTNANANKLNWVWETYYKDLPITRKNLEDLKSIEIKEWCLDQIEDYSLTRRKYNEMKSVFNMMLDYAVEMEIVSKNVARNMSKISDKHFTTERQKSIEEQVFLNDEKDSLINMCVEQFESTGNVAYLAICLNTALALRVGELVALKVSDFTEKFVHIERQEITNHVPQNDKYVRCGYCIVDYTKTPESIRELPLTSISRYYFSKILEVNQEQDTDSEYLINGKDGKRLNSCSINNALSRVNKKINTIQKGNHSVRKTCLSNMCASNQLTDEEIRMFAGHKDFSTTRKNYIFPTNSLDNRLDAYESAIVGKEQV